ncbi:serine-tRNA ligase [Cryptococcus tetragattii IND107]|uniref:serine--tRNA ligase n=1 Tax=Cryptococcus tetragattii IND107 TaxID=1296105 RepID=A0ABR3BHM5_9TREE|nr:serine-tRNA ligase [Cryptococcus tetragattii IND107]
MYTTAREAYRMKQVAIPARGFSTRPPLFAPVFAQTTLPKPRLDYTKLLLDPPSTLQNAQMRAFPLSGNHLSDLSSLRDTQRELLQKLNVTRARQKEVGNSIRKSKGHEAEEAKRQAKELKLLIKDYELSLSTTESSLLDLALSLPNFSHPSTPIGPEENARTLETFGPTLIPSDPARDHVAFAQYFSLLDTSASAKTTGSSWPYLRGSLALLEQALISYTLSIATKHGFMPVIPPDVVKTDIAWRCGFQPRDQATNATASQTYHLEPTSNSAPSLCLAGTSEIPLAGMFADMIIPEEDLPQRVVGVGRAFRAEAGARGADTRGLYRVHQFTKVELFVVSSEEESESVMEEMRGVQKEIVQGLGLSVRVLDMPTEELGASAHRKYDMEAWMPGRGKWGEISSTSNCTDYQSRRLSITYRPQPTSPTHAIDPLSGPLPFAHTLNGTAAAIPRLLVALIENGLKYEKTGEGDGEQVVYKGLELPKALQRFYVGSDEIGERGRKGLIHWV